ncbi:hypothetical protein ACJIZ3_002112 [Penstemon smallii]|uniref:Phosphatidylinositol N-acetylglucosaminyltransferase subunit H conserved domain-containing protein n=1 Tax=Penstemon smallii TaxID=265156 RepID=A0ABD3U5I4_9LAMI
MVDPEMEPSTITKGIYTYVHDVSQGPPESIDVHHIIVSRSRAGGIIFCAYAILFALICLLILLLLQRCKAKPFGMLIISNIFNWWNMMNDCQLLIQDKSVAVVLWGFTLAGFLLRQSRRKLVMKESVIILPAFGVQLETFYMRHFFGLVQVSGRTVRHFVPIDKILKPVLNECVTPVTCYWSLSLIIREQEQLLLVFKELYPPISMLVPIWKALCASINEEYAD